MGCPGVGAPCWRIGTPGRGAMGAPGPAGRGCESLAARSGRGGTIGRAAGCPARPGRAIGVRAAGAPGDGMAGEGATGAVERAVAGGVPVTIRTGSAGRMPAGRGCLGPDKIWPGRGADGMARGGGGTSRAGAAGTGVLAAGAAGMRGTPPAGAVASGGRRRCGCGAILGALAVRSRSAGSVSRAISAASGCGFSTATWAAGGSSTTAVEAPFEPDWSALVRAPAPPKIWRSFSATSSSTELE
jgi:hypothetical protein